MKSVIAVCVSTFRRPAGLEKLLAALRVANVPDDVEIRLVIVDNEAGGDTHAPLVGDWPVTRVVEEERGIPFSRNRAVAEAGEVDAIIFFDDDEQPHPDCLEQLIRVWRDTEADVVQGASVPAFELPPPSWIVRAGYFRRDFDYDGQTIASYMARTSNVLVRGAVLGVADPPFDRRLGLIGSEDTFLFRTAEQQGFTFVAAPSAVVDEHVPASRVDRKWLVQRQYRTAWGRSFHLKSQNPSLARRLKRVFAGLRAIALTPLAVWRARPEIASMRTEGARSVAYGWGLIVGLVGRGPSEYAEIHGD